MADKGQIKETENQNEKVKTQKDIIAELVAKAKIQYAWYVDLYPENMRDNVAKQLLTLEAGGAVGCEMCGIPSGMSGLTFRSIRSKTPEGKTVKQYMCYHCITEELNKINARLEENNKLKA